MPCCSTPPGGIRTRQGCTSAQRLNALVMGPKVPATKGIPVELNHHRLEERVNKNNNNNHHGKSRVSWMCLPWRAVVLVDLIFTLILILVVTVIVHRLNILSNTLIESRVIHLSTTSGSSSPVYF